MFNAVKAYIKSRHVSVAAVGERDALLQGVRDARQGMNRARAHYESLLASIVWTPEDDKRVQLAYNSFRNAEAVYVYLLEQAKQQGIMTTWEDVAI